MEQADPNDDGEGAAFSLKLEDGLVVLSGINEDGEPLDVVLGSKDESCEIMCRFMTAVAYGECG